MLAKDVFQEVRDYWEATAVKMVEAMSVDDKNLKEIADKCLAVCRDQTVNSVDFTCLEKQIDDNDQLCVQGTILDVKEATSDIYPFYKKFATCAKNIIRHEEGIKVKEYICKEYCIGCREKTKAKCIETIKKSVEDVFKVGGVFDEVIQKAEDGDWK